ncbi:hypothetical protein O6H91_14G002000 [Diphasiastrum complanatum]|uniref:Uncharacterized protein n=1 Tax=Diphasiastrum complanatum TaxID=34168 RepID=A0ACC2BKU6_DIPCM|nr:hypothetical protein O6H91_14G002000 [Diphasiastrum complanatum]
MESSSWVVTHYWLYSSSCALIFCSPLFFLFSSAFYFPLQILLSINESYALLMFLKHLLPLQAPLLEPSPRAFSLNLSFHYHILLSSSSSFRVRTICEFREFLFSNSIIVITSERVCVSVG